MWVFCGHIIFNCSHVIVYALYLRLHHPVVHLRQEFKNRVQHRCQWDKNYKHAFDQGCQPEWKMLLKKWATVFVKPLRFVTQWEVSWLGRRKLSGFLKNSGLRMNLRGSAKQQVLNGWVQVCSDGETGFGSQ